MSDMVTDRYYRTLNASTIADNFAIAAACAMDSANFAYQDAVLNGDAALIAAAEMAYRSAILENARLERLAYNAEQKFWAARTAMSKAHPHGV